MRNYVEIGRFYEFPCRVAIKRSSFAIKHSIFLLALKVLRDERDLILMSYVVFYGNLCFMISSFLEIIN